MSDNNRNERLCRLLDLGVLDIDVLNAASYELYGQPLAVVPTDDRRSQRSRSYFVYVLKANGLYKIGRSVDPDWRTQQLQTALAYTIEVVSLD